MYKLLYHTFGDFIFLLKSSFLGDNQMFDREDQICFKICIVPDVRLGKLRDKIFQNFSLSSLTILFSFFKLHWHLSACYSLNCMSIVRLGHYWYGTGQYHCQRTWRRSGLAQYCNAKVMLGPCLIECSTSQLVFECCPGLDAHRNG